MGDFGAELGFWKFEHPGRFRHMILEIQRSRMAIA
jgi:hypothetical protein